MQKKPDSSKRLASQNWKSRLNLQRLKGSDKNGDELKRNDSPPSNSRKRNGKKRNKENFPKKLVLKKRD